MVILSGSGVSGLRQRRLKTFSFCFYFFSLCLFFLGQAALQALASTKALIAYRLNTFLLSSALLSSSKTYGASAYPPKPAASAAYASSYTQ